jgi:hypothetical protein
MSLTRLLAEMKVHQNLPDQPTPGAGYTAQYLKQLFDQAPSDIKEYINGVLIPEIEAGYASKEEIQNVVLDQIPDGTLTDVKLSNAAGQVKARVTSLEGRATTSETNITSLQNRVQIFVQDTAGAAPTGARNNDLWVW